MIITKGQLKKLISEEKNRVLNEVTPHEREEAIRLSHVDTPSDPAAGEAYPGQDLVNKHAFLKKVNWSAWNEHFAVAPGDVALVRQAVSKFYDQLNDEMMKRDHGNY